LQKIARKIAKIRFFCHPVIKAICQRHKEYAQRMAAEQNVEESGRFIDPPPINYLAESPDVITDINYRETCHSPSNSEGSLWTSRNCPNTEVNYIE
jgi:hypothetical protein